MSPTGSAGAALVPPDIERFRRILQRALDAHGEWCYWRRTVPEHERERLADAATDAERRVIAMYEDLVTALGASPTDDGGTT